MTKRDVTLILDHSLQEAVRLFGRHSFHHLPVVDQNGRLAGVVSDRDALRGLNRTQFPDREPIAYDREMFVLLCRALLLRALISWFLTLLIVGSRAGVSTRTPSALSPAMRSRPLSGIF